MKKKAPAPLLKKLNSLYNLISHPYSFVFIVILIAAWFVTGPVRNYDETWYKSFHLFEMSLTLLMVFVIESTQQADNRAVQEKLDEIIKKMPNTDNSKIGIEKHYKGEKEIR